MDGMRLSAYRLLEVLGTGGTATVWLARAEEGAGEVPAGARVAVKVFHAHLFSREDFFLRFLREVEIGRTVRHENVVRVLDAGSGQLDGEGETVHYLVMDYVSGQTLRELHEELGGCAEDLCRHVGREVAKALAAIHAAGIVHRDVKPENVLITRDEVVKLMDLGVARVYAEAMRLSHAGQFAGTPLYTAPEQLRGGGDDVDGRTDLYGLGLVLYELGTGTHPFPSKDLGEVLSRHLTEIPRRPIRRNPRLSPFFDEVIFTLLQKEKENRFRSADELVRTLEEGENSDWWATRRGVAETYSGVPLRRLRIPRETALYGRERELGRLREIWGEAKSGAGRAALLLGEAGIGKSRLVDEFAGALDAEGEDLHFLFGIFPPGGAATASCSLCTAVADHFGAGRLEDALTSRLGPLRGFVDRFAALLRGEPTPPGVEPLTKDAVQSLFLTVLRSLAEEKPTILLVDDLHFAPEEGRALFAALAHGVPGHRLFLVGTSRPGVPKSWLSALERLNHVTRVEVDRVGPRDLQLLLEEAFGTGDLADELGARIAMKSDGNPFFVFEILSGLRDAGRIRAGPDGVWCRVGDPADFRIPDSVRELVMARVADLPEDDRDLLDVAACAGFEFDPLLVAEALGRGRIPVLKDLSRLERGHGLVMSSGRAFLFDHHQLRDAIYEALSDLLREAYHGALGDALAARHVEGAAPSGAVAQELCRHLLAGGKHRAAFESLHPALDHLEAGHATEEAIALADRFLEIPRLLPPADRARLLLRRGRWLNTLGRWDEQEACLTEAIGAAEEAGETELRVEGLLAGSYLEIARARYDRARDMLDDALASATAIGARRQEGAIAGALGIVQSRRGNSEEARRLHERHLEIAREVADPLEEAKAAGNLAHVLWQSGSFDDSRERYQHALALFRETGNRHGEAQVTGNLGAIHYELGRYEEAREHWVRQLDLVRETGYRRGESMATGNLGCVLRALGRYAEAEAAWLRDLELVEEMGDRRSRAETLGQLGVLDLMCGRLDAARARWDEAFAVFREADDRHWEGWGLLWLAQIAECGRRLPEAEKQAEEALAIFREVGARPGEADTLLLLGRLRALRDDPDSARASFAAALEIGRETGIPGAIVRARACLASLPGGDPRPALEALGSLGARMDRHELMESWFAVYRGTGDPAHLAAARRTLDLLADHAPEGAWDSMMESVPLHRQIRKAGGGGPAVRDSG